jgi:hypothetical protein
MPADNLAYFQERLLALLWETEAPATIRDQLLTDPKLKAFHAYIEKMDPHMLEVAAELVHKWGYGREKQ